MIEHLGHAELAQALRALTRQTFQRPLRDAAARARAVLDNAPIGQVEKTYDIGGLVGGIVTRAARSTMRLPAPSIKRLWPGSTFVRFSSE